jgi:hypothetical protein
MLVQCSWCLAAGLPADLGEKAPFEDRGVSHSVCPAHKAAILADLPAQLAEYRARREAGAR